VAEPVAPPRVLVADTDATNGVADADAAAAVSDAIDDNIPRREGRLGSCGKQEAKNQRQHGEEARVGRWFSNAGPLDVK
jgi:hypothetical protein